MPRSNASFLGQLLGTSQKITASALDDSVSASLGGGGVTTYATAAALPLSGNTTGDQAFVSETGRLYIFTGAGWYNIALINTNPNITSGADASYSLNPNGTPTVVTLIANDPEGLPITWSYSVTTGSLSNGGGNTATVTQADNVFTITPSTTEAHAGEFEITFTASDGVNLATSASTFTLSWYIAATGGAIEYVSVDGIAYKVHTFTSSGTFIVDAPGVADILLVGGGGGGGGDNSGGGGAGGLIYHGVRAAADGPTQSSGIQFAPGTYTVTVGAGGSGSPAVNQQASSGDNSSVVGGSISLVALGGGYGGTGDPVAAYSGANGGSGGGAATEAAAGSIGTATQPGSASGGYGYNGGSVTNGTGAGGGGGGAGGAGQNGDTRGAQLGGSGGAGIRHSISGSTLWYAAGGDGGNENGIYNQLARQNGIGGQTNTGTTTAATGGIDGTGSGGGGITHTGVNGAKNTYGGFGGDGIVIIRYPVA